MTTLDTIRIKNGATFDRLYSIEYEQDEGTFVGWTGLCEVYDCNGKIIQQLDFSWIVDGHSFRLTSQTPIDWPVTYNGSALEYDVRWRLGDVYSPSQTGFIEVDKQVTRL